MPQLVRTSTTEKGNEAIKEKARVKKRGKEPARGLKIRRLKKIGRLEYAEIT